MDRMRKLLFCDGDLRATLDNHTKQIFVKVDAIPEDQFLATLEDDLVEHIESELHVEPLSLYEDSMEMEQHEIQVDVSGYRDRNPFDNPGPIYVAGIRVTVSLPYTGDSLLWKLSPNSFQTVFPQADVREPIGDKAGHLEMVFEQPTDEKPEQMKQRLDRDLELIRFYVDAQRNQVEQFTETAPDIIRKAIKERRERLKKHSGLADMLGIQLKRRDDVPAVEPIHIERTLVKPLPPPPKSGFEPEPGIADEDYDHILSVIRHEGRTFEATPQTYAVHDEEGLRDIILAHLNGHYKGGATGETFRRNGKTDIRIEAEDRAAFVAECKIWRGQKELTSAINQLLGYLTWRDCKAAILIFNKHNAKFTELLEKIPETLRSHQNFRRDLGQQGDGEWRYSLTSTEDEQRQIILNVSVFNIYVAQ